MPFSKRRFVTLIQIFELSDLDWNWQKYLTKGLLTGFRSHYIDLELSEVAFSGGIVRNALGACGHCQML